MQRKWPLNTNIQQVTTHMHSSFWMFSLNEQHQTLDCFYSTRFLSLPWSIKCITQTSDVNPGFICTSTHSPSCSAQTGYFSFSDAIWVVLWQCYFVPRTNYCLSSFLRAHSVYFLSLLNLWKKRASLLSCLPTIPLCIPVEYKERGGGRSQPGEDKQIHSEVSC